MIRRASLPLVGLLATGMVWVDGEFAWRVTSGKASLAWLTAPTWVRLENARSNMRAFAERIHCDIARVEAFYGQRMLYSALRLSLGARWRLRMWFGSVLRPEVLAVPQDKDLHSIFEKCRAWLQTENARKAGDFLTKRREGQVGAPRT